MKYIKKPIIIDAWRLPNIINLKNWESFRVQNDLPAWAVGSLKGKTGVIIPTLEGDHVASAGDFIIKGFAGEYYPCKPDIFTATYELA
jgi:hypothetical protein